MDIGAWTDLMKYMRKEYFLDKPIIWLAMVLIYSDINFLALLRFLTASEMLGRFKEEEYNNVKHIHGQVIGHEAQAAAETCQKDPYSFILPSGISSKEDVRDVLDGCLSHILAIELFCHITEDPNQPVPSSVQVLFGKIPGHCYRFQDSA